jgi:hypothetical protein
VQFGFFTCLPAEYRDYQVIKGQSGNIFASGPSSTYTAAWLITAPDPQSVSIFTDVYMFHSIGSRLVDTFILKLSNSKKFKTMKSYPSLTRCVKLLYFSEIQQLCSVTVFYAGYQFPDNHI